MSTNNDTNRTTVRQPILGELSPLLFETDESPTIEDEHQVTGSATVSQTVINVAKTCMGTGTLALPYAAHQAGLLLNTFGLLSIAAWTIYSIERLCHCLELLPPVHSANCREGTSTMGKVAFFALGPAGLLALETAFALLLVGIIVAYLDAALSFLGDTPFTTGVAAVDAFGTAVILGLLSNVPDMGYLAKASAAGLIILALTFSVIGLYGDFNGFSLHWWPENGISGVSHWFGCVVFGFGTVPLTYSLRDSMAEPTKMVVSATFGLTATAVAYVVLSTGILLLYPTVGGDILQELPTSLVLPTVVRLAMVVVVLMTAPLLVVPCSELVEGKLFQGKTVSSMARAVVRVSTCVLCATVTLFLPGFVYVLSFVGCCWCLLSFVFPPLVHILLSQKFEHLDRGLPRQEIHPQAQIRGRCYKNIWIDYVMLVWGCVATIISSVYTFGALLRKS